MNDVRAIVPIAWTGNLRPRKQLSSEHRLGDSIQVEFPRYFFPPKIMRGRYGEFFEASVAKTFNRAVEQFKPDVILAAWAYPDGWAAVEMAHHAGLPAVVKVHGSDIRVLRQMRSCQPRLREVMERADGVIAVSQDLANQAVELGADPSRVRVIYDGVDSDLFHPGDQSAARATLELKTDEPVVLFIGNLVPIKGIDILLQACAALVRRGVAFRCVIVGEGKLRPKLESLTRKLDLEDRVQFRGAMHQSRLPTFYHASSLVVLPSHSEGVPSVLLEAAACGKRFVASRVGGIPEIARSGFDRLVEAGDADALADALYDALNEPSCPLASPPVRGMEAEAAEIHSFLETCSAKTRVANLEPVST